MTGDPVILINAFEVPDGQDVEFLQAWERMHKLLSAQEGYLDSRLHRSLSPSAQFRFVNIARWQSPQAFQHAISQAGSESAQFPFPAYPSLYEIVREDAR